LKEDLKEWVKLQDGFFTGRQASDCGYTHALQKYHSDKGNWEKVRRGLFRWADYPESDNSDYIDLSLWSHDKDHIPQLAISHESALSYYGLTNNIPYGVRAISDKKIRRNRVDESNIKTSSYSSVDVEMKEGFLITTCERTLEDVLSERKLSKDILVQAVEQAIDKGLVQPYCISTELLNQIRSLNEPRLTGFIEQAEDSGLAL